MLHHCFTQPPNGLKTNGLADMWASRSKPKQGIGFTSNGQHSSSISRLLPPTLSGPPAPAFGVQRHCFALLSETLPRRRPGHPSTPHLLLFSAECDPTRGIKSIIPINNYYYYFVRTFNLRNKISF